MLNQQPIGIIDIGSNSVRLVVYAGAERQPAPIFNEKVMAGLGTGLAETGRLADDRMERGLAALARFRLLLDHMAVAQVKVVATAAVRDAENGPEFVRAIDHLGFQCEVLSGEEEAHLAGEGVLSAIPEADGIVGDLGGGSIELVRVSRAGPARGISLPLGVLRLTTDASVEGRVREALEKAIHANKMLSASRGTGLYMVGGSWRSLARMDMLATGYPLPIVHQYEMEPGRAAHLLQIAAAPSAHVTKGISSARLATLPQVAMLLSCLVEALEPSKLVVSTSGIREGVLFASLPKSVRQKDPLIEEVRCAAEGQSPFGPHGERLNKFIGTIFDDPPAAARIRLAACLLGEIVWQANPGFRAERGVEMALHGNWVAVNAAERVMLAAALASSFGSDNVQRSAFAQLCTRSQLARAHQWGLAMRLGQRLSGGVSSALAGARLDIDGSELRLSVRKAERELIGDAVGKRLRPLAEAMGRRAAVALRD